jgi:hypothetical protein
VELPRYDMFTKRLEAEWHKILGIPVDGNIDDYVFEMRMDGLEAGKAILRELIAEVES